jgi:hypothetical protein
MLFAHDVHLSIALVDIQHGADVVYLVAELHPILGV